MKKELYIEITQSIVEQLEKGVRPWVKPWEGGVAPIRPLRHDGTPYKGINVLILWSKAEKMGYMNPRWMTYRQAKALGGQVCKGEKSTTVVFAKSIPKEQFNLETGETEQSFFFTYKQFYVFNVDQIDDLPDEYHVEIEKPKRQHHHIEEINNFFLNTKADIRHGGSRAFYTPTEDFIKMPHLDQFPEREHYYATLGHECVHWTKQEKRCNRDMGRKSWGDMGYAMEELVAELGAAYLCADLGITPEVREDHASYIKSWLTVLKDDNTAIFKAASKASQAVDFLHSLQED